jgi:hypothetical protein
LILAPVPVPPLHRAVLDAMRRTFDNEQREMHDALRYRMTINTSEEERQQCAEELQTFREYLEHAWNAMIFQLLGVDLNV